MKETADSIVVAEYDFTADRVSPDLEAVPFERLFMVGFEEPGEARLRAYSEKIAKKATKIIDDNNLAPALSLRGAENSILHNAVASRLLRDRLYKLNQSIHGLGSSGVVTGLELLARGIEKQRAMIEMPLVKKTLDGFTDFDRKVFGEHFQTDLSPYRARTIEMAVNDLFIKVRGEQTEAFHGTTNIVTDTIASWTAQWQPRVWEESPAA